MVCEPYIKLKPYGGPDTQQRLYIMTTHHIYTFKNGKRSIQYNVADVGAIVKSSDNQTDCMIFFERSQDLIIRVKKERQTLLDLLKLRFNCLNRNVTLRVFSVSGSQLMIMNRTNSLVNKRQGIFDLPDDSVRLRPEEI